MYTLHIANKNYSSWSLRPWLVMEMLGIPFREVLSPFGAEDFTGFSPSGKVPCLIDGGRIIWDSLAITEYLAERHQGVWPTDADARAWARCAAAEMHSGFGALREYCSMSVGVRVALHKRPEALLADVARIDALWCEGLDRFGGPFLAGAAFSAVDAFFAPVVFRFATYRIAVSPPATAYAEHMLALEPMTAWREAALAEPWRDPPHDDEIARAGAIVEDLRV